MTDLPPAGSREGSSAANPRWWEVSERIAAAERARPPHQRKWWRRWFFTFEPRDLWVGVYIAPEKLDESSGDYVRRTYFALIPTIVLVHQRWYDGVMG